MKAIILAAGEGKRLRPLTYTTPKVMLQVCGKPLIHHLVDELKKAGITEVIILVKHLKDKIINYFEDNKKEIGIDFSFVEQGDRYGTGSALLYVEDKLSIGECFIVIAGDSIVDSSIISKIMKSQSKLKDDLTHGIVAVRESQNPTNYGVFTISNDGKIISVEEKPKNPKSNLINISVYLFNYSIFERLSSLKKSKRGEYEIIDILVGSLSIKVDGFWMDIGYPWDLLKANSHFLENIKNDNRNGEIKNSTIVGKVVLENGAKIINSYVEGNLYLGKNSTVGPNAYIRGNVSIGRKCSIGGGTTVKNCIIMNGVNAKHLAYLGDSIIGNSVNFGSGTQLSNYRFDAGKIKVKTEKGIVDSGRNKFGCIVGDNVKFGVISSVMPGKLIGNNCWIGSGVVLNENLESHKKIFLKQEYLIFDEYLK